MTGAEKTVVCGRTWLATAVLTSFFALMGSPAPAQKWRIEVRPIGALQICAAIDRAGKALLTARSARGCLSSSCRRFVRSTLTAKVSHGNIHLSGDLLHRKPVGPAMCTRDCAGARTVSVAIKALTPGRYEIVHNGKAYGMIELMPGGGRVCVTGK
ncbi:MAG: hypothetical protein KDJ29_17395 [Hyphomicrobiales bacterium]|nr:hypothetical protein [Hyphomicrobiales bacterium]